MTKLTFLNAYRSTIETELNRLQLPNHPQNLYEPIHYTLSLGGKRLRPIALMMACELFGQNPKIALEPALGIELFHNFTLIHDDIMDQAEVRRGKACVHQKWDLPVAILSGDVMQIIAQEYICKVDASIKDEVLSLYHQTAKEVCEGQQMDMNFETADQVSAEDYVEMIGLKTAVLFAASLKMGAMVAKTSVENQNLIYDFGKNIGTAFQLHDDWLDTFGAAEKVGKKIGGDILANKKTMLYLKALEAANPEQKERLTYWFSRQNGSEAEKQAKISEVTATFKALGVAEKAKAVQQGYEEKAFQAIKALQIDENGRSQLKALANALINRAL